MCHRPGTGLLRSLLCFALAATHVRGQQLELGAHRWRHAPSAAALPQMAVAFAEMHDTPTRMVAKGVLHGIVPWNCARPFLAIRLRRRCAAACVLASPGAAADGPGVWPARRGTRDQRQCAQGLQLQAAPSRRAGQRPDLSAVHPPAPPAAARCLCGTGPDVVWNCRLAEEEIVKHITTIDAKIDRPSALKMFRAWCAACPALCRVRAPSCPRPPSSCRPCHRSRPASMCLDL